MLKYLSSKYKSSLNEKIPPITIFQVMVLNPLDLNILKTLAQKSSV
jgi:hypothetical protein